MPSENSVTHWIDALKTGDEEAARQLWVRYFEQLVRLARRRLEGSQRRVADEEDVALSVFRCLCSGVARGKFSDVTGREDLWRLLATITTQKAIDQRRLITGQKRGGGMVRGESIFGRREGDGSNGGLDQVVGEEPTPEFLTLLADEHERFMRMLEDDTLRQTAQWKLEGLTNGEIAERLGLTRRSVERKLQLIRQAWSQELTP